MLIFVTNRFPYGRGGSALNRSIQNDTVMDARESLNAKPTDKMTVAELKTWLASRGAPTKGRESELLDR